SSARLLISSCIFGALGGLATGRMHLVVALESFAHAIFACAMINSLICIWQLSNAITGFPAIPQVLLSGHLWKLPLDIETFRKAGLLNSFQTSSMLSLMGILTLRYVTTGIKANVFVMLLAIPIIFGARTFIPILI